MVTNDMSILHADTHMLMVKMCLKLTNVKDFSGSPGSQSCWPVLAVSLNPDVCHLSTCAVLPPPSLS